MNTVRNNCLNCSKQIIKGSVNTSDQWVTTSYGAVRGFSGYICGHCARQEPIATKDLQGFPVLAGDLGIVYP